MAKRAFDVFFSAIGLLLLSPVFLVMAVAIKLDSPGAVFYRATRVGKGGDLFKLYKFRTMVAGADKIGPGITVAGDPRVTRIGRFLRRTKLDEFPQLINVLKGEMSLVGPRPEDPRYVALYTPEQREVLKVLPGVTSPASIQFRHEEELMGEENWEQRYREDILPAKLAIDVQYVQNATLGRDIQLLLSTFLALFESSARPSSKPSHES